ncbi:MAG TPA: Wzy polymerase domain-containing protein, partial [Burkholderiaceae bacterium]|nr:Wzy polymerase domain-containing protein [Burkholderiaceae bacterium]
NLTVQQGKNSLREHGTPGDNLPMQLHADRVSSAPPTSKLFYLGLVAFAFFAIWGSAALAYNPPPSATFLNQVISLLGWAGLAFVAGWGMPSTAVVSRRSLLLLTVPLLLAVAAIASMLLERLPSTLAFSSIALLAAAAVTAVMGSEISRDQCGRLVFQAVCVALVLAGVFSVALALVQVFKPSWTDVDWIARGGVQGRAGGNLRQPNHLSSLLLWSMVALVWLHESPPGERRVSMHFGLVALLMMALVFGVVLTVSRTGALCILLLALWGALDKHLSRRSRVLLCLLPLAYVLCWGGMSGWSEFGSHAFAGDNQLHKSDPSSSRFGIWANTLELIKRNPWFGVGWGEFNFAWTLTPFPGRPTAFFDHTHNLPLQFLVELGIPLGTLVLALLAWALWKALCACRMASEADIRMVRAAFVMVLMMAVHSMLEYPLWYAYFLLPTAFAFGICLGHAGGGKPQAEVPLTKPWLRQALMGASLILYLGTAFSVVDYMRVVSIFAADEDMPLSYRIARGQKSVFFAHHADYAAATVADHPSRAWPAFRRAPHYLLDTRLMIAWATAYAEKGDVERARYLAERLREFRNPDAAEFFAECDKTFAPNEPKPFQCTPSTRHFTYEDFKLR